MRANRTEPQIEPLPTPDQTDVFLRDLSGPLEVPSLVFVVGKAGPVLAVVEDHASWGLAFEQRFAIWWLLAFGDDRDLRALEGRHLTTAGGHEIPLMTDAQDIIELGIQGADDAQF